MKVSQFLLVSVSILSLSSFAEEEMESTPQARSGYNAALSASATTVTLASLGVLGYNSGKILRRAPKIGALILASATVWELAAKLAGSDEFRFSNVAAMLRDKAVVPFAEHAGYGFWLYYDAYQYVMSHVVTVGKELVETAVFTPLESARDGIDAYSDEVKKDQRSVRLCAIWLSAASFVVPVVVSRLT